MRLPASVLSPAHLGIRRLSAILPCLLIFLPGIAGAQDCEHPEDIEDAVLYDHNPSTHLGDDVFGTIVADFSKPVDGRKRCSHGGPVCLEYADGTLAAFYANTSSHNTDGWSETALSKDGGKTWDKYHPFAFSKEAYEKDPKRPVWIEEGLVTDKGTVVLFLTRFAVKGAGGDRVENLITRSHDHGKTWSEPEPMADAVIGYPAAVVADGAATDGAATNGAESYVLFDSPGGPHVLYVSTDDGETWTKRSTLPLQEDAWYGGMCRGKDGRLTAGAYVTKNENHLYYCTSDDGGKTWSKQRKASLDKSIRDPELAYLDGKYYLHGRSGHGGPGAHRFVLYQSDNGTDWRPGVIVSGDRRGPDGYSHNCIINKYDQAKPNELMVLYSIVYEPPRTCEYVFFVKPVDSAPE